MDLDEIVEKYKERINALNIKYFKKYQKNEKNMQYFKEQILVFKDNNEKDLEHNLRLFLLSKAVYITEDKFQKLLQLLKEFLAEAKEFI